MKDDVNSGFDEMTDKETTLGEWDAGDDTELPPRAALPATPRRM
jgi:hypothetical protein